MENASEKHIYFWLSRSGASVKKLNALLSVYSPSEVWESIGHEHFEKALGEKLAGTLRKTKKHSDLDEDLKKLEKKGIFVVTRADDEYPERLNQKEVNPPLLLYCKGDTSLLKSNCIAVIGARRCSRYGKEACEKITKELVAGGVTIVAGLATGIDGYAHAETVYSRGKTIAVLGAGFEHIYPAENFQLYQNILNSGGLVACEYPPESGPQKYTFPERNRIISGLSSGVVVVEAEMDSGSLITTTLAQEQGREVFAVPGNITSKYSEGTNNLISEGHAMLATSAKKIFEVLKLTVPQMKKNTALQLDFTEQTIYNLLDEPCPYDEIAVKMDMPHGELTALLSNMELRGIIKRLPSNFYSR